MSVSAWEYMLTAGRPAVAATAITALVGGVLGLPVVLRRMAFIGQGMSHAAFGGVGLAALLGIAPIAAAATGPALGAELAFQAVLVAFSMLAGVVIVRLARARGPDSAAAHGRIDTAIGVVLAVSMALGYLLLRWAADRAASAGLPPPPGIDAILFGSVLEVGWGEVWVMALLGGASAAGVLALGRPLAASTFDPAWARAAGVRTELLGTILLLLLSAAIIAAMRLVGVALLTALLVIPAASALRVCHRLPGVLGVSLAISCLGMGGGLVAALALDWPVGATSTLVLGVAHLACRLIGRSPA